jgi:hypothetical protein
MDSGFSTDILTVGQDEFVVEPKVRTEVVAQVCRAADQSSLRLKLPDTFRDVPICLTAQ